MISAGSAAITEWAKYNRNCNVGLCRHKYIAPVPSLYEVTLFINFGTVKPDALEWTIINLCQPYKSNPLTTNCFIIAYNGRYWYGVFTQFKSTEDYSSFIIAASTGSETFFSEQYQVENPCETLTKISVCYPSNYNADDTNGIYIGAPDLSQSYSGKKEIFYRHNFWTRQGEIIETQNKITFTSNSKRNFATTLTRQFEFRPELVPGWYKDYLLSVYFRGNILINDNPAIVTDINFEDVDVDYWKAYAVLGKEVKGGFGCSPIECPPPVCVCYPPSISDVIFEPAVIGVVYNKIIPVTGTGPFELSNISLPSWVQIQPSGNNVIITGTPGAVMDGTPISFTITNECGAFNFSNANGITVVEAPPPPPESVEITGTITDLVRNIRVQFDYGDTVPFDVLFALTVVNDDGINYIPHSVGVQVLAGQNNGTVYNAVPDHVSCIQPSTEGGTTFEHTEEYNGTSYHFLLTIVNPCS